MLFLDGNLRQQPANPLIPRVPLVLGQRLAIRVISIHSPPGVVNALRLVTKSGRRIGANDSRVSASDNAWHASVGVHPCMAPTA